MKNKTLAIIFMLLYCNIIHPWAEAAYILRNPQTGHTVSLLGDIHTSRHESLFSMRAQAHFATILAHDKKPTIVVEATQEELESRKKHSFDELSLFKKLSFLSLPCNDRHFRYIATYFGKTFYYPPVEIHDLREGVAGKLVDTIVFLAPQAFKETQRYALKKIKFKKEIVANHISRLTSLRDYTHKKNIVSLLFKQRKNLCNVKKYQKKILALDADTDEKALNRLLLDARLQKIVQENNKPQELQLHFNKKLQSMVKKMDYDISVDSVVATARNHVQDVEQRIQSTSDKNEKALWKSYKQKFETVHQDQLQLQTLATTQSWIQESLKAWSQNNDYSPVLSYINKENNIGSIWANDLADYGFMTKIIENKNAHKPILLYVGSDHVMALKDQLLSLGYAQEFEDDNSNNCLSEESLNNFFATLQQNL
ncbi:MAG: hypothetical protein WC707_01240 [Candidatus Babeliaceae bacterium]|jgi:hypothetical protein